jgi:hypothetical protein
MVRCEAHFRSNSGPISRKCNEADGHFVARPQGSAQNVHSRVAAFDKGPAIACKLRLAVNVLGASYIGNLYRTLH